MRQAYVDSANSPLELPGKRIAAVPRMANVQLLLGWTGDRRKPWPNLQQQTGDNGVQAESLAPFGTEVLF